MGAARGSLTLLGLNDLITINNKVLRRAVFHKKEGSSGSEVEKLQQRFKQLGFNPGPADGEFGPASEAFSIGESLIPAA
jgi:peptidoglycan hydrolase-like protein with peptidoglycan-binding domain